MEPSDNRSEQHPLGAAVLDYLRRPGYRPMPQRQLLHLLNVRPEDRPEVRRQLRRLLEAGRIVKLSRGRLALAPESSEIRGRLQRHRDGYGFVVPEGGGEDLYVASRDLGDAMSGDTVVARVTRRGRGSRLQGVLVRTLARRSRQVLAVFVPRGKGGVAYPFDARISQPIHVPAAFRHAAERFQVVSVDVLRGPGTGRPPEGKVLEVLGHLDDPGIDVTVVARKYGLSMTIPESVTEAAEALPARIAPAEKRRRERFDDPSPVTIDGETAQDFDDAIAVKTLPGGGFRLFVHIADVSHFVAPSSVLDREARARGTSVYFPGTVLPMFPERLSNDLCSLRPGVERLVQSAILDFDREGRRRRTRFADGVIRSAARLTYTQVAAALDGGRDGPEVPRQLLPMLRDADRLRERLSARRAARGSVDFDLPEPRILLDVEGMITGITIEPRNRAHQLIEEFMLAANEAVASHLEEREDPCMYRIHDPPDPLKLEALADFAEHLGYAFDAAAEDVEAADLRRLLEQAEDAPDYPLLCQVALRSMKQARYSMLNSGHFGLAAPTYAHFTSPIRRYPDLLVHRLLRASRGVGPPIEEDLEAVASACSELERNAEAAERELLSWKKVELVRGQEGNVFDGVVTGVARFGLFVQLTDNLVEGLLRVEGLGGERYEFDERRQELRGRSSGRRFRLGDRLRVRVDRVDRILRRVDFSTVGSEAPAAARAAAAGRTRGLRRKARRTKSGGLERVRKTARSRRRAPRN